MPLHRRNVPFENGLTWLSNKNANEATPLKFELTNQHFPAQYPQAIFKREINPSRVDDVSSETVPS